MHERCFTKAVAELGERDRVFALNLARVLTGAAISTGETGSERARELREHLPRMGLKMEAEISDDNDRLLDWLRNVWRSKYDWLFSNETLSLVVEVKLYKHTRYQPFQLSSLHRALTDRRSHYRRPLVGLLVIAPRLPPKADAIHAGLFRNRAYLGAVLWRDVMPDLRALSLHQTADNKRWQQLLDVPEAHVDHPRGSLTPAIYARE